jgi:hypothetical protein
MAKKRRLMRSATAGEVEELYDEIKRQDVAAVNVLLYHLARRMRITFTSSPYPYYIHDKDAPSHLHGTSRNTLSAAIYAALEIEA